jgi:phage terminase small subunit
MEKTLTPKQEQFCQEYIIDFNGSQSAIRAGYSKKGSDVQAFNLLRNIKIQSRIKELLSERSERTKVTQDDVINEIAMIALSDIADYVEIDEGGGIKAKMFENMAEGKSRVLQSIEENRAIKESADGKEVTVYDKIKFKLWDKMKALPMLAAHLGLDVNSLNVKLKGKLTLDHKISMTDLKKSMTNFKDKEKCKSQKKDRKK